MSDSVKRYLFVPDVQVDTATVVSAVNILNATDVQEAQRIPGQPVDVETDRVLGDLMPTMEGLPERETSGTLVITASGPTEGGRFGWVRSGADPDDDLQLRNSPNILGKRPDLLEYHDVITETEIVVRRPQRPKLLSLQSGDLLAVWLVRDFNPVDYDIGKGAAVNGDAIYWSRLDHLTDTWSDPVQGPAPQARYSLSAASTAININGVDVVQYPDTGEIVMVILAESSASTGTAPAPVIPTTRMLFTWVSKDDGTTWVPKKTNYFNGSSPDILLEDPSAVEDTSSLGGMAIELLDSGRLIGIVVSRLNTWSLYSDDRGTTWRAVHVADDTDIAQQYSGHGVACTKARNGVAVFAISYRDKNYGGVHHLYMTRDGIDYSSPIGFFPPTGGVHSVDVSIGLSPDGWIQLVGTVHVIVEPGGDAHEGPFAFVDWMWAKRILKKDVELNDTVDDLFAPTPGSYTDEDGPYCYHAISSDPAGQYFGYGEIFFTSKVVVYKGFVSLDTIHHRGQIVTVVQVEIDDDSALTTPAVAELTSSALMAYRQNYWQPIREGLTRTAIPGSPSWTFYPKFPIGGLCYNRTWDCYTNPKWIGFTETIAGTTVGEAEVAGAEGGYWRLEGVGSGDQRYYTTVALPNALGGRAAALRAVVMPVEGGSLTNDAMCIRLQLAETIFRVALAIRFEATGGGVNSVCMNDSIGGGTTATATFPEGQWIEVLLVVTELSSALTIARLYARSYDRASDPDWLGGYTSVGSLSLTMGGGAAEYLTFGNWTTSTAIKSYWKTVQLHRSEDDLSTSNAFAPFLSRLGVDFEDSDYSAEVFTTGTGRFNTDEGLWNFPRGAVYVADPPQFLQDGCSLRWRGEAASRGQFEFENDHTFSRRNVLELPVMREWRSSEDDEGVYILLDAGEDNAFRPDALAVFGRNSPEMTIAFNEASDFSGSGIQIRFTYPGSLSAGHYSTHLWAWSTGQSWGYYMNSRRVTVFGPTNQERPWRPGQFASGETGAKYYIVFRRAAGVVGMNKSASYVYRIKDNTSDTLTTFSDIDVATLRTSINGSGVEDFQNEWAIFSDRFATTIEDFYPSTGTNGNQPLVNSHAQGYRYCRVYLPPSIHGDADEQFARLGYLLLGHAYELSGPQPELGFARSMASGNQLTRSRSGSVRVTRNSPPIREWSFAYAVMSPAVDATENLNSPDDALDAGRRTWAHWESLVQRIQVDGTPVALLWEGDRAAPFAASLTFDPPACVCDPNELVLCRVTEPGSVEQEAYLCRTVFLPEANESLPRPLAAIRGIRLTEEF